MLRGAFRGCRGTFLAVVPFFMFIFLLTGLSPDNSTNETFTDNVSEEFVDVDNYLNVTENESTNTSEEFIDIDELILSPGNETIEYDPLENETEEVIEVDEYLNNTNETISEEFINVDELIKPKNITSANLSNTTKINIRERKLLKKKEQVARIKFFEGKEKSISDITYDSDRKIAKAVVHIPSREGIQSVDLIIPRVKNTGNVYVCPGAEDLSEVYPECPNVVWIQEGQKANGMTLKETVVDGLNYYILENITGTGAGEWWNLSFAYRIEINITENSGNTLTDYQVFMTVNTQSFITQGKMKSDCGDIRFANKSGYVLDYYIENSTLSPSFACNTTSTRMWFKVPNLPASSVTTIYGYYGNPSATTRSNGNDTFEFFDDFEDGDISDWTQYGTGTVSLVDDAGNNVLTKTGSNDPNGGSSTFNNGAIGNFELILKTKRVNENGGSQNRYGVEDGSFDGYGPRITDFNTLPSTMAIEERSGGVSTGNIGSILTSAPQWNTWMEIKFRKNGTDFEFELYNSSDELAATVSVTDSTYNSFDRFVVHGGYEFYTDDIRVRKYINPEPTFTFGGEEESDELKTCQDVDYSGSYTLIEDLYGASIPGDICIKVHTSDVVIDCGGYTINNNGTAGTTSGILLNGSLNNVTVKNCKLTNYTYGISMRNSNDSSLLNNTLFGNEYGIYIDPSYNNTIIENNIYNSSQYGLYLEDSHNNTIRNNSAWDNTDGFYLNWSSNNTLINNTARNNSRYGIAYYYSNYTKIFNNTVNGNAGDSITGTNSDYVNISYNSINYGGDDAIFNYISLGSSIIGNTINYATNDGMDTPNNTDTSIFDNVITDPGLFGIRCDNCYNVFINNTNVSAASAAIGSANFVNSTVSECTLSGGTYGLYLIGSNSQSNVILNNTAYGHTQHGFYIEKSSFNNLTDNTAYNNLLDGFFLFNSSNNNHLNSNRAYNNTEHGFRIRLSNGSTTYDNIAYENGLQGIRLATSDYNNLTNNTAYNNSIHGFRIDSGSDNNTLESNQAYNNTQHGFRFDTSSDDNILNYNRAYENNIHGFRIDGGSDNNNLTGNSAYDNIQYGFRIDTNSQNTLLINNSAYENDILGFRVDSSPNNKFINNSAYSNTQYGLYVDRSANTNASNTHTYNNGQEDFYVTTDATPRTIYLFNFTMDNPSGNFENYTSLSISDTVEANTAYSLNWTTNSSALPVDHISFRQKFVNITSETGTVSIDSVVWHWSNSELSGYSENIFDIWKYNSSGWSDLNATLDTAANTLTLTNMNPASDYGILQSNVSANITNVSASPVPQGFYFNVTIQANVTNADTVFVGITPPGENEINYTMTNISEIYSFNYYDWVNGTYYYKVYANDSTDFWYNSSQYNFTLYQNLSIQIKTMKDAYAFNETINITDPELINEDAPMFTKSEATPQAYIHNGDSILISANLADKAGVRSVTAVIPTSNGEEKLRLTLSKGTVFNGTWSVKWKAHDTIGKHFIVALFAENTLGNVDVTYVAIDDPPGVWVIPTSDSDPTGLWTNRPNARDGDTHTYASDNSNPGSGWGSFIYLNLTQIESDKVKVWADYGAQVNSVDVDVFRDGAWTDVHEGPIDGLQWYEMNFTKGNVTSGRFRFNYTIGGWIYWLYEFQFYNVSTQVNLPIASTVPATSIEQTTAVIHAKALSDGGDECQMRFLYGTSSGSYTNSTSWIPEVYTATPQIGERLENLQDGQTYYFIAQINNSAGSTNGSEQWFTTGSASPGWVTATGYQDPSGNWSDEEYAFDDELTSEAYSYHEVNDPDGVWSFYLFMNRTPTITSHKLRFNAKAVDVDRAEVDIYNGSTWINVYNASFIDSEWTIANYNSTNVSQARIRFRAVANNRGFQWRLAEFDFYKTVATPVENQSKIENHGPTNASCYLFMKTQYWNGAAWVDDDVVVNETTPRTFVPTQLVKLDTIWNPENYTTNNLSFGDGWYRVYTACLDNESNVLMNLNGSFVNTTYNFTYSSSPPLVNITSPINDSNYTLTSPVPIKANVTDQFGLTSVVANISYSIGSELITMNYNATSGLWETDYLNTNYVDTYKVTIIATSVSGAVNDTEFVYFNVIDITPPEVILDYPPPNYNNETAPLNITFVCNATDNYDVNNISLYITDSNDQFFSLNQTEDVSGVSTYAEFDLELAQGSYTWNCLAYDSSGNYDWGNQNRSIVLGIPLCYISGEITDASGSTVPSIVQVYDENGSLEGNTTQNYNISVICNQTYDFVVIPDSGNFTRLTMNNLTVNTSITEVADLEDSPETMENPGSFFNWTEAIAWSPNMTLNFTSITVNMTYSGANLGFYKCSSWNYTQRNCTDDNWTFYDDVIDGYNNYSRTFAKGDPGAGVGNKPNVTGYLRVYDVTGLPEAGRKSGGTLIGTYLNGSQINFSSAKSYRIEIFLNNTEPNTNGIIRDPYHDNIPNELTMDMSGADAPNVTVVAGAVTVNSFTATNIPGTETGTRKLTWDADPPHKLIENLNTGDLVKLWYVVDYIGTNSSLNNATFYGDVQGTNDDVELINPFSAEGGISGCFYANTPNQTYTLSANLTGNKSDAVCITVNATNITIDCAGFSITGNEPSTTGIFVDNFANITIINCVVNNYTNGFYLNNSNDSVFLNNTAHNNSIGFYLDLSSNNNLTNNTLENNTIYGIFFDTSSGSNSLYSNSMCFNSLDVNNTNTSNSGNLDECDSFSSWDESGHQGCQFTCSLVWNEFYGNLSGEMKLAPNTADMFYTWLWNGQRGKIYVINGDASISWINLTALGRMTNGSQSTDDFTELDTALGYTSFEGNVNDTFSTDGSNPKETQNISIFERTVDYIPVANSSTYLPFKTGIVWDGSQSTNKTYDENEDVVFLTEINGSQTYDYQMIVPGTFDTYKGGSGVVEFWAELD